MARIRTIKPELWTDPEFVECSPNARLLFVAALNFASDYGVLPDKPKQLKMQCFPGDTFDIDQLVDELVAAGFWERRTAPDGARVLVIRTFTRHQKVDKPTPGRWGDPETWPEIPEPSPNPPRALGEPSPPEGNGREGIMEGKGKESSSNLVDDSPAVIHSCDDDDFLRAVELIVEARMRGRTITNRRGYALTARTNTIEEDGELIRRLLSEGSDPERVAAFVLGYGFATQTERATGIPWCPPDCGECDGTGWVWVDDNAGGYVACPERLPPPHTLNATTEDN